MVHSGLEVRLVVHCSKHSFVHLLADFWLAAWPVFVVRVILVGRDMEEGKLLVLCCELSESNNLF